MWWRDYRDGKDPEIKADKAERTETREWLSRQDARVRTIVEQTAVENDKLRKRVDDLETDVASERKSGMDHYERSLRMYDVYGRMVAFMAQWPYRARENARLRLFIKYVVLVPSSV